MSKSTSTNLTEMEILSDFLSQEKQLVRNYAGDITEASCPNLRQLLTRHLSECSDDQLHVFQEMNRQTYAPNQGRNRQ